MEWLAFRLTMLGCEFEVHELPKLANYCVTLAPASSVRPASAHDDEAAPLDQSTGDEPGKLDRGGAA